MQEPFNSCPCSPLMQRIIYGASIVRVTLIEGDFWAWVQAAIVSYRTTHGRGITVMWTLLEPMAHSLQTCWP